MNSTNSQRLDGRKMDEIRPLKITRNYLKWPEGSVLIEQGDTKIIVTASIEENVPRFLKDSGKGWITSEYDLLPRATNTRRNRDRKRTISGRSHEIQRLIGRAMRAAFDFEHLGEITVKVDADVIQADGGTRCASITGGFVAVYDALQKAIEMEFIQDMPAFKVIAAISVGIVNKQFLLDLFYEEDSQADVDMNIVMDEEMNLVEIQGTAEGRTFNREELKQLLDLAEKGIKDEITYIKNMLRLS